MTDVQDWVRDRANSPSLRFEGEIRVVATHDQHLGPRWEHAEVILAIAPAPEFIVELPEDFPVEERYQAYARAVVLGFLDVAMVHTPSPIRDVRLVVHKLSVDPIDSTEIAFRKAGRLAAHKLIGALQARPAAQSPPDSSG